MFITVGNPTAQPVLVSDDGKSLGGGEFGSVDDSQQAVRDALASGLLLTVDRPSDSKDLNPGALAAFDATDAQNGVRESTTGKRKESN